MGHIKKCPPLLSVCVAGKLIRSGQKSKTRNQISTFLVLRLTLVFSQHASMFGCWRQHTTPTNSSTEVVITLVTSMYILSSYYLYSLLQNFVSAVQSNSSYYLPFLRRFRYTAYRQLVRWCWGYLGKHVRVALPSCAVNRIREIFPADFPANYTGLKPPNL